MPRQNRTRRTLLQVEPLEERCLLAGEFTDMGSLGLAGVRLSATAWADYDNDGNLDVLLTGEGDNGTTTGLYRNQGNGSFTQVNAGLPTVQAGSVSWGDYDNDGYLDLLLSGFRNAGTITRVYHNNGNGTFTDINAGLPGMFVSTVQWGDYDNDGHADILLMGAENGGPAYTRIYRNNHNGTFTDIQAALPRFSQGDLAWGDYDRDGDLDVLLSGLDHSGTTPVGGTARFTRIYRNNGNGTFTDIQAGLADAGDSSVAWGDYNNDGYLDIALSGDIGGTARSFVYRNNGDGTFTDIQAGLTHVDLGSVAWGDYDNDGLLDLVLTGAPNGPGDIAQVYRNNGNGIFTDIQAGLTGVSSGSAAAWGDYDGDGDLDILLTGYSNALHAPIARIYRNNAAVANTAPAAPTNLTLGATAQGSLTLSWNAATDTQTPANGLSYNLRIGTTPGGSDILAPAADATTGWRRLAQRGSLQTTSWPLAGPFTSGQTYYWSVQAVDTSLAGSAFAAEASFTFGLSVPPPQTVTDPSKVTPFSAAGLAHANAAAAAIVTVTYPPAHGSFTNLGGFTGAAGQYTFQGTAADAQAALRGLTFTSAGSADAVVVTPFTIVANGLAAPLTLVSSPASSRWVVVSNKAITFVWPTAPGADYYDIWVDDVTVRTGYLRNPQATGNSWAHVLADRIPGHTYRWWAGAVRAGATTWGAPQTFALHVTPVLTGPAGAGAAELPTFTWQPADFALTYDLWVDNLTTGQSQVVRNTSVGGTSWTATQPLTPGHTYRSWVRGVRVDGRLGPWSRPLDFVVAPLPAPTATGPSGNITTDQPTFEWSAVAGAGHYDVWVANLTTGQTQVVRSPKVTGTSWKIPSGYLIPWQTYRWWVGAVSANGQATFWSSPKDFTLAAPEGLSPSHQEVLQDNRVTFQWTPISGGGTSFTSYEIWVDDLTTGRSRVLGRVPVTGSSWTTTLFPGHSYRWWVGAIKNTFQGMGPTYWSRAKEFSIAPLATPTPLLPDVVSSAVPEFTWSTVPMGVYYEIWVDDVTTGQSKVLHNPGANGSTWTANKTLTSGHRYRWWVRAWAVGPGPGDSTPSAWSNYLEFTVV